MIPEQEKDIVKWYVVGISSVHQELRVRNDLRQAGMESYVPLSYEMKMINGRRERKLVPTITGLVFVRTSFNLFKDYAMGTSSRIYLRKSSFSNKEDYLTVSDQDMQRFIDVTTAYLENISYFKPDEVTLHAGELVEIQIGSKTYQAEIKRIKGKRGKRLVVEIPVHGTSETEGVKIVIKGTGDTYGFIARALSNDSVEVKVEIPAQYDLSFSVKADGKWTEYLYGTAKNTAVGKDGSKTPDGVTPFNPTADAWNVALDLHSNIPGIDATDIYFAIGQDPSTRRQA